MSAYYNENDPKAAAWLRELIKADQIAPGDVDERSIEDVTADDLKGYDQHHFFAGIGGWSYALRLAGWPDDRLAWTGSCPCQPFSAAGKGDTTTDPRHLWPAWFELIAECRPECVFGEQVASVDGLAWLDTVYADLEGANYAVGAVDLCAAGVGAPHRRQRLWFVAEGLDDANPERRQHGSLQRCGHGTLRATGEAERLGGTGSETDRLADAEQQRSRRDSRTMGRTKCMEEGEKPKPGWATQAFGDGGSARRLADAHGAGRRERSGSIAGSAEGASGQRAGGGEAGELGHAVRSGRQQTTEGWPHDNDGADPGRQEAAGRQRLLSPWSDCDWLPCRDGKSRPVRSGTFPLAHGLPARVGRLRGYGNAIVPQVAAEVIKAYLDARA